MVGMVLSSSPSGFWLERTPTCFMMDLRNRWAISPQRIPRRESGYVGPIFPAFIEVHKLPVRDVSVVHSQAIAHSGRDVELGALVQIGFSDACFQSHIPNGPCQHPPMGVTRAIVLSDRNPMALQTDFPGSLYWPPQTLFPGQHTSVKGKRLLRHASRTEGPRPSQGAG
jgi:hypothetical protein